MLLILGNFDRNLWYEFFFVSQPPIGALKLSCSTKTSVAYIPSLLLTL